SLQYGPTRDFRRYVEPLGVAADPVVGRLLVWRQDAVSDVLNPHGVPQRLGHEPQNEVHFPNRSNNPNSLDGVLRVAYFGQSTTLLAGDVDRRLLASLFCFAW